MLIVKLSVSPCLDFFFFFPFPTCVWHLTCGGLRPDGEMQKYMYLLASPVLRQALLVDTRLGAWPGSGSGCALPH